SHHVSAALGHLKALASKVGVVQRKERHARRFADDLRRFDEYMQNSKGLAESTRRRRVAIISTLLDLPIKAATPSADELRKFLAREFSRISSASAGVTVSAVRGYLRFRAFEGERVDHLVPVVARPANWRFSTLPKTLSPQEIDRLLAAFPPDLPSRLRCYAIVRSVVDLGLRSSEVIGLTLDDIDWQAGTVRISRSKTRRADVLPLPYATGAAIATYLRSERPETTSRRIFVRHVSPVDKPVGIAVVRRAVRNAYRRAGLSYAGVHILRHTLASRMLNTGSSLKDVADVLRHRALDSSLIYAKVDFHKLSVVAMPWPGSHS
ncbi:tyrosine-type recombinase/integrase, partial [Ralstonia pseudosolanacearum]